MQSAEQFYVICVIQKKHRVKPLSPEKSFPLTEKLAGIKRSQLFPGPYELLPIVFSSIKWTLHVKTYHTSAIDTFQK